MAALVTIGLSFAAGAQVPPRASDVFRLTAQHDPDAGIHLIWTIAPGTYLYRDRIRAATVTGTAVPLSKSQGSLEDDPTFGSTEIYKRRADAVLAAKDVPSTGPIVISFQGCAEQGVCYPAQTRSVDPLTLAVSTSDSPGGAGVAPADSALESWAPISPAPHVKPEAVQGPTLDGPLWAVLATFFGFGVLLAFTPCVFPMIPILSGILTRSALPLTAGRGFRLSATYAVSAALAYAALGVVAAWSGANLQTALQTPAVLGAMSLVFVLLALSSFGLFELQLPSTWTTRVSSLPLLRGGSIGGAAALGFASALIVGPCVTPPLAAALLFVAQGGSLFRGATTLFALGLGMGVPLVAMGTFGAGLLPRAGAWMMGARQVFGVVFLGVAILLLSRVISGPLSLLLWALLAIGVGAALGGAAARDMAGWGGLLRRAAALSASAYGVLLLVGFAGGAADPLRPLEFVAIGSSPVAKQTVQSVRSPAALEKALANARTAGKPVFLDYAAAWCVSCRAIDKTIDRDGLIQRQLARFQVIRADVTDDTPETRALMARYGVIGMPTLVFLSAGGTEVPRTRLIGDTDAAGLGRSLALADHQS